MSRILNRTPLVGVLWMLVATHANAQDIVTTSSEAPAAPIEQAGRLPGDRIQVDAGTGDGVASVSFSLLDRGARNQRSGSDVIRYHTDTVNLIVSTPWDGDNDAQPATLDGLANGTKLTLRWGRHVGFLTANRTAAMRELEAEARGACRAEAEQAYQSQLAAAEAALLDDADPAALERRGQIIAAERDRKLDSCAFPAGGWGNLINDHLPARSPDYIAMLRPRGSYEFGLEGSISRNGFEYVDVATLVESEETKVQWAGRAYFTYYPVRSPTAFTITAGYERAYEPADEAVFCPANPNNVVIRCTTARAGAPELNESLLLSAGLRHRVTSGVFSNVAIAPVFTYDVLDDVVGVDVPVYFVPNSDGGLTGGVRFGYRSDRENEFSVGIFIGAAFNVLGGR